MMQIGKYSFGIGDRFALQGKAQLQAILKAAQKGVEITPVWSKSHREHTIIGTKPTDVRAEANAVVKKLDFKRTYFVDADHINLSNVDLFTDSSDFFTIDVADYIGLAASGGRGLELAKEIYAKAMERIDELCGPYKTVIDIDRSKLPSAETVQNWSSDNYVNASKHDRTCKDYNSNLRQLQNVGYKIAAEMGNIYLDAVRENESIIAEYVTQNIYKSHIKPLFID